MSARLKQFVIAGSKLLPLSVLPLDGVLRLTQRLTSGIARLIFLRDWQIQASGRPQFFKHEVNLSRWTTEPSRWSFLARGVYARERMFRNCCVLDLCCGDGSYSYLFFSDIARHIDALDNDLGALKYAAKYHSAPNIRYRAANVISEPFPSGAYDFVVWNAAICYFSEPEIKKILAKIAAAGGEALRLSGMLPRKNGWVDHKTEFETAAEVCALLKEFFGSVTVEEIQEASGVTFYFQATQPLRLQRAPEEDRAPTRNTQVRETYDSK